MRLRTRASCAIIAGVGLSSLAAFAAGCVADDNAAPLTDSGIDSTTTPEASTPGPDAGSDTGTDAAPTPIADAGQDASDAAPPVVVDGGVDAGCSPVLAANWKPPAYIPVRSSYQSQCDLLVGGQVEAYWDDCLADAGASACASWLDSGVNEACATCLVTPQDAGYYGAAVIFSVPQVNLAGCIQLADPSDAGITCATAIQAAQTCVQASCTPSCAITTDPATVAAYVACTNAAATSTCITYVTAAATCITSEQDAGGSASSDCFVAPATEQNEFDDFGHFFCDS